MVFGNIHNIILGGASLSGEGGGYGFGMISESQSQALIESAWERGIRIFDTAPIYGFGLSEERLGRYLPKDAHIITKGGVSWHPNKRVNMSNDPKIIAKMVEESLKRLKRDAISTYMIHWPDSKVDIRVALEPILKLKEKGYIQHVGLANTNLDDLKKTQQVTTLYSIQIEGNFLVPDKLEKLRSALPSHCLTQSWGTLAKGILTGRVTLNRSYDSYDARSWAPWWKQMDLKKLIDQAQPFLDTVKEFEISPLALAIVYNFEVLKFNQVIVGFKSLQDLEDLNCFEDINQRGSVHKKIAEALNFLNFQSRLSKS
jgi:aryl-alcohol dehydrogenase-like predicted oxidoreductase